MLAYCTSHMCRQSSVQVIISQHDQFNWAAVPAGLSVIGDIYVLYLTATNFLRNKILRIVILL